jgi:hypothetical protein
MANSRLCSISRTHSLFLHPLSRYHTFFCSKPSYLMKHISEDHNIQLDIITVNPQEKPDRVAFSVQPQVNCHLVNTQYNIQKRGIIALSAELILRFYYARYSSGVLSSQVVAISISSNFRSSLIAWRVSFVFSLVAEGE